MLSKLILICLSTALLTWLLLVIRKRHSNLLSKRFVVLVYWLKIVSGIGMSILYSSYYPVREEADIYKYFDDSKVLYDAFMQNPHDGFQAFMGNDDDTHISTSIMNKMNHWYRPYYGNQSNDSHLMIRFNTLLRFVSFGHYEVHVVVMSLISLLGLLLFFNTFKDVVPYHNMQLLKLIFFIPSILIWSSSVLKEGFVILAMGLLVWSVKKLSVNIWRSLVALLSAAVLLYAVKLYIILAFLPGFVAFLWVRQNAQKPYLKYLTTLLLFLGVATNLRYLGSSFDIFQMLAVKQRDFMCLAEWVGSGSMVYIPRIDGTLVGTLAAVPNAMINVLFRPWPLEISSMLISFAMLENWIFILVFIYILWRPLHIPPSKINTLLLWMTFIIILYVLIGITTPVLGAIVRYKLPAWPFLIVMICTFTPQHKLRWISKLIQRL